MFKTFVINYFFSNVKYNCFKVILLIDFNVIENHNCKLEYETLCVMRYDLIHVTLCNMIQPRMRE